MNQICKRLEEALACGDPLSGPQRQHLARCESCLAMQSLSKSLQTTLGASQDTSPPLGFSTRLKAQVHSRTQTRPFADFRSVVLVVGGVLAAAVLFVMLRSDRTMNSRGPMQSSKEVSAVEPGERVSGADESPAELTNFAADLVALADVENSLQLSADWDQFLEPLSGIETLAKELEE